MRAPIRQFCALAPAQSVPLTRSTLQSSLEMLCGCEAKGLVQTTRGAALDVVLTEGVHDDFDGEGVSQEGIGDCCSPDAASPSRRPNREPGDLRVWRNSEERTAERLTTCVAYTSRFCG
ncbi:MAG: hypothetical protein M3Q30_17415 [Actinomycetota bacterium]|nr:hypothetical protein [Actinomycetota bacterium]